MGNGQNKTISTVAKLQNPDISRKKSSENVYKSAN